MSELTRDKVETILNTLAINAGAYGYFPIANAAIVVFGYIGLKLIDEMRARTNVMVANHDRGD